MLAIKYCSSVEGKRGESFSQPCGLWCGRFTETLNTLDSVVFVTGGSWGHSLIGTLGQGELPACTINMISNPGQLTNLKLTALKHNLKKPNRRSCVGTA